jgi:hypothetical protein|tara:strand:- start:368 stop:583 length:216 start_codon:yes stop_codon:yes gene_type:complete
MNNPNINVGDLVIWIQTEPHVLGLVMSLFEPGFYSYSGIEVLWFGSYGQNLVSPCRTMDVKVLSSAQPKKS